MTRTLLLACFTTGCAARDGAMRPMYEIPMASSASRPFATEEASVHAVTSVLESAGFPMGSVEISVEFNPELDLPMSRGRMVIVPRWITPDEDVEARLSALIATSFGVTLDLGAWTPEQIQAAWSALQLAQLTDQAVRLAELEMGLPADLSDPGAPDRRAVDAHMPVLNALVDQHRIPVTWPEAYRRLLTELAPLLPPEQAPVVQHALDRARAPLPLGELITAYDLPDATRRRIEEAMRSMGDDPTLGSPACTSTEDAVDCTFGEGRRHLVVRYWEELHTGSARWVLPFQGPASARPGLLSFVNEANAFSVGACTLFLEDQALVAAGAPFPVKSSGDVSAAAVGLATRCGDYFDPFLSVAEQGRPADQAWAELRARLEEP